VSEKATAVRISLGSLGLYVAVFVSVTTRSVVVPETERANVTDALLVSPGSFPKLLPVNVTCAFAEEVTSPNTKGRKIVPMIGQSSIRHRLRAGTMFREVTIWSWDGKINLRTQSARIK